MSADSSSRRYQVATGSNDDTIRIWDLRMHQAIATIPAHKSAVSDLKFFQAPPKANAYPDCELPRAFAPLPIFAGEEEQSADVSGDKATPSNAGTGTSNGSNGTMEKPDFPLSGSFLVSSGFDGYVKVWSADDWQLVRALSNDKSGKVMSVDVSSGTLSLWTNLSPTQPAISLTPARTIVSQTPASSRAHSTIATSASSLIPTPTCRRAYLAACCEE